MITWRELERAGRFLTRVDIEKYLHAFDAIDSAFGHASAWKPGETDREVVRVPVHFDLQHGELILEYGNAETINRPTFPVTQCSIEEYCVAKLQHELWISACESKGDPRVRELWSSGRLLPDVESLLKRKLSPSAQIMADLTRLSVHPHPDPQRDEVEQHFLHAAIIRLMVRACKPPHPKVLVSSVSDAHRLLRKLIDDRQKESIAKGKRIASKLEENAAKKLAAFLAG